MPSDSPNSPNASKRTGGDAPAGAANQVAHGRVIIGADEAGYGPNLGPLVISATCWRLPASAADRDLYDVLSAAVCRQDDGSGRLAIADSKSLYQSGGGLAALEQGVWAALAATGQGQSSWRSLCLALSGESETLFQSQPWYSGSHAGTPPSDTVPHGHLADVPLPVDSAVESLRQSADCFAKELARQEVTIDTIGSRIIFPDRFNQLLDRWEKKSDLLSMSTLGLVRDMVDRVPGEHVTVLCDKHGGRNRYAALLQEFFPDTLVRIGRESRAVSVYECDYGDRTIDFRFSSRGEAQMPTALASMVCKYLRELSMIPFNRFWQARLPGLRPTAGYPVDAKRFRAEIEQVCHQLAIPAHVLWRRR